MSNPESAIMKDELELHEYGAYYTHVFWCRNCGQRLSKYVKKGTLLKGLHAECDNCGCEVLLK